MGWDLPIVGSEPVEGAVKLYDICTIEDQVPPCYIVIHTLYGVLLPYMGWDLPIVGSKPVEGAIKLYDICTIEDQVPHAIVIHTLYGVVLTTLYGVGLTYSRFRTS